MKIYILKSGTKPLHLSSYQYPKDEDVTDYYKESDLVEVDIGELSTKWVTESEDQTFSEYLKEHMSELKKEAG